MMKQTKLLILAALAIICSATLSAQTVDEYLYVNLDDQPDATYFLPPPPSIGSAEFVDDLVQFQWGKTQRNTPRGEQASEESLHTPEAWGTILSEVLGLDAISDEATPALSRLLQKSFFTGGACTLKAKDVYMRTRPFVQMNDPIWAKYDDELIRLSGSYPSGHTALGWFTALAFAEMWPALQDDILRRGFMFGESRVIVGAHYQSDVTAGYLCAAATFARAHANPDFQQDIQAARAEYARLKGMPADSNPAEGTDVPHGEKFLGSPVDTTSYRYISDLTLYWDGKALRDTKRGEQASHEADYSAEMMYEIFSEATGTTISAEKTPAISKLIGYVLDKCSVTADRLKEIRFRKRPFVQLGEPSFVPGDEEKERGKSSFPSGHTNLGWTEALVMTELAPDHQNEILKCGYEYGYNRQIVGYHWFTDVIATRQLASALYAYLHSDAEFQKLMQEARKEYQSMTASAIRTFTPDDNDSRRAAIYTLDGRRVYGNPAKKGIYISDGKKVVN